MKSGLRGARVNDHTVGEIRTGVTEVDPENETGG